MVRAGTVLIARGEFSLIIASLATTPEQAGLSTFTAAYVIVLAVLGPLATGLADTVARH